MAIEQPLPASNLGVSAVSLNRLLARLEKTFTSPQPSLRSSRFERAKVGANLEYARSLLLRLEHDNAGIKLQSRKQSLQADLQRKRDLIQQLNARLEELNKLDDHTEDDDEDDTADEEEDVATHPSYAPAVQNVSSGIDTEAPDGDSSLNAAAADVSSNILRSRRGANDASRSVDKGTSSGLFNPSSPSSSTVQTEKLLDHESRQQDDLTTSILSMAQQMKANALKFNESLESEKSVLSRAGEGLEGNSEAMEGASKRMGMLRRMTEGKGWWDRMMLYGTLLGLWVVAFVVVFVLPKLRF